MKLTLPPENLRRANVPLASFLPNSIGADETSYPNRAAVVPSARLFSRDRIGFSVLAAVLLPLCGLQAAAPELHVFPTVQADAIGQKLQSAMVWADPSQNTPGVAVVFRKTFQLSAKPARADLHLFADARYVLWVNGSYVERGPNRFQPNGPEYDTINVAPFLKAGRNVIAVIVAGNLSGGKIMKKGSCKLILYL